MSGLYKSFCSGLFSCLHMQPDYLLSKSRILHAMTRRHNLVLNKWYSVSRKIFSSLALFKCVLALFIKICTFYIEPWNSKTNSVNIDTVKTVFSDSKCSWGVQQDKRKVQTIGDNQQLRGVWLWGKWIIPFRDIIWSNTFNIGFLGAFENHWKIYGHMFKRYAHKIAQFPKWKKKKLMKFCS